MVKYLWASAIQTNCTRKHCICRHLL